MSSKSVTLLLEIGWERGKYSTFRSWGKKWTVASKSVTVVLQIELQSGKCLQEVWRSFCKLSVEVESVLKKRDGPSGYRVKKWKVSSKVLRSFWKLSKKEMCPRKAWRSFWKLSENLESVLKKCDLSSKNWVKRSKVPSKSVTFFLEIK